MKRFLILLLVLNIVFFVWQSQNETTAPDPINVKDEEIVETLVLLSETVERQATVAKNISDIEPDIISNIILAQLITQCFTVGPLVSKEQAGQVISRFNVHDIYAESREESEKIAGNYWVSLERYKAFEIAKRELKVLKEKGVTDISVISLGKGMYSISLGVFSKQVSTNRRVSQITALGYSPHVEQRFKSKVVYWVDYAENEAIPLPSEILSKLPGDFVGVTRQQIPCP